MLHHALPRREDAHYRRGPVVGTLAGSHGGLRLPGDGLRGSLAASSVGVDFADRVGLEGFGFDRLDCGASLVQTGDDSRGHSSFLLVAGLQRPGLGAVDCNPRVRDRTRGAGSVFGIVGFPCRIGPPGRVADSRACQALAPVRPHRLYSRNGQHWHVAGFVALKSATGPVSSPTAVNPRISLTHQAGPESRLSYAPGYAARYCRITGYSLIHRWHAEYLNCARAITARTFVGAVPPRVSECAYLHLAHAFAML